jgi:hypothetical protein
MLFAAILFICALSSLTLNYSAFGKQFYDLLCCFFSLTEAIALFVPMMVLLISCVWNSIARKRSEEPGASQPRGINPVICSFSMLIIFMSMLYVLTGFWNQREFFDFLVLRGSLTLFMRGLFLSVGLGAGGLAGSLLSLLAMSILTQEGSCCMLPGASSGGTSRPEPEPDGVLPLPAPQGPGERHLYRRICALDVSADNRVFLGTDNYGDYWRLTKELLNYPETSSGSMDLQMRDLTIRSRKIGIFHLFLHLLEQEPPILLPHMDVAMRVNDSLGEYRQDMGDFPGSEVCIGLYDTLSKEESAHLCGVEKDMRHNGRNSYYFRQLLKAFERDR